MKPVTSDDSTRPARISPYAWLLLGLFCAFAFFWQLGGNGLFDLDEALYVESAREMHLTGDYVTPRVNGQPFFEKPPLIYWEAAGMFALFGRSEFTARLPSALATVLIVALIGWFGSRHFGQRAGLLAASAYALCPMALGTARQLTTDATLTLCITAALLCFFTGYTSPATKKARWYYGFWAACALGVLAKGAPGILIPLLVALLFLAFEKRFNMREILGAIRETLPMTGFLLFLLIALPWHVAAYRASGEAFTAEYIIRQHIGRFRGGDTSHLAPFWFFIPAFLAGFFPWSLFVPAALLDRDANRWADVDAQARTLLKVWAVAVFVMFSASGSKLVSYILPMYPAAALLAGDWCNRALDRVAARRTLAWCGAVGFVVAAFLLAAVLFHRPIIRLIEQQSRRPVRMDNVPPELIAWAGHLFLVAAAGTGIFLALVLMERRKEAFAALAGGMALFIGIGVIEGLPIIDRAFVSPLQSLAAAGVKEAERRNAPLVLYVGPPRRPSTLFYLPDEMLRQGVTEVMDEEKIGGALALAPTSTSIILTNDKRATALTSAGICEVIDKANGWTLLRFVKPDTAP
jgi:4-amino-4-deoxy-L-arabinose transferase-like glycosyltransferase